MCRLQYVGESGEGWGVTRIWKRVSPTRFLQQLGEIRESFWLDGMR